MSDYTVLVSGFPDAGPERNPTGRTARQLGTPEIAERLRADTGEDIRVIPVIVPLSFENAWPTLKAAIDEHHPQMVAILGRHRLSHGVDLERCARNRIEADHPDADKRQPLPQPVREGGPSAYWTRLPLSRVLNAFATHHVPASLASDNGTFVCNALFYHLMDWCAQNRERNVLGGLMALPDYRDQTVPASATTDAQPPAAASPAGTQETPRKQNNAKLQPVSRMGLTQATMTEASEQLIAQTILFYAQSNQRKPLVPPTSK